MDSSMLTNIGRTREQQLDIAHLYLRGQEESSWESVAQPASSCRCQGSGGRYHWLDRRYASPILPSQQHGKLHGIRCPG